MAKLSTIKAIEARSMDEVIGNPDLLRLLLSPLQLSAARYQAVCRAWREVIALRVPMRCGSHEHLLTRFLPPGGISLIQLACGVDQQWAAVTASGELWMSRNGFGLQRVAVPGGSPVAQVACASTHTLAVTVSGELFSCGGNDHGQCGLGHAIAQPALQKVAVPSGARIMQAACGGRHTIVLTANGELLACGDNSCGQLALGQHTTGKLTLQRVAMPGGSLIAQVGCGRYHTLAVTVTGELLGCGDNSYGQLSLGRTKAQPTFQKIGVPGGARVAQAAGGGRHTLVVTVTGELWACGSNVYGQLGLGHTTAQYMLQRVAVPDDAPVSQACCSGTHTVVVTAAGHLLSCGHNLQGQLGLGHTVDQAALQWVALPGGSPIAVVACGFGNHTFAL